MVYNGADTVNNMSNSLLPETTLAYTHDAAGCVTRIARAGQPALDLTWDPPSPRLRRASYRLTSVSTNGVVVEAYGYDPFGRRAYTATATSSGSITNWHAYDGIHCVADLDADGNVLRSYTILLRQGYVGQDGPGVDNLLAITDHTTATPTSFFALTDHLGTVHALADATGAIVESYSYDAWGNVLAVYDSAGIEIPNQKSQISNRFLFQGREHSWATGLTNFRARWYDPATGRWLSNDPIGISGGLNQYVFCGNDPVNYVDPMGLRDYTAEQTKMILRNAVREYALSSLGAALLQANKNHGFEGKYDYKINTPSDTFIVGDRQLAADQFGNYIAGYATYGRFGNYGTAMTRLAGHWFEFWDFGNEYWLDCPGSSEMISQGVNDFYYKHFFKHDLDMSCKDWQQLYNETMAK